jgi:hypothetical protein
VSVIGWYGNGIAYRAAKKVSMRTRTADDLAARQQADCKATLTLWDQLLVALWFEQMGLA